MINAAKCLKAGFADLGISEKDVVYAHNDHGKPYAQNHPTIHFSITHTNNISICAFCDNEIGIDCEISQRHIDHKILMRYFSKDECDEFSAAPLLLWVSKEAIAKYDGKGLALTKKAFDITMYENELELNGIYLMRLEIPDTVTIVCAERKSECSLIKVT